MSGPQLLSNGALPRRLLSIGVTVHAVGYADRYRHDLDHVAPLTPGRHLCACSAAGSNRFLRLKLIAAPGFTLELAGIDAFAGFESSFASSRRVSEAPPPKPRRL